MKKSLTSNLGLKVFALLLAVLIYHSLKTHSGESKENDRTFLKYFRY